MRNNILSIIIPAYNEEEAIGGTLKRTLSAIDNIKKNTELDEVEVIVISDGSSDRTVDIVKGFKEVTLISYEKNRGYGAAIKTGFQSARGWYLGFMDADGTCDPNFFINLVKLCKEKDAHIALGSRLHSESKMPLVRRVGNVFYATLLTILSGRVVKDSASGMRVLTRDTVDWVYALPDGLHFTPAMSAYAMCNREVKILEEVMPYHEREGESKLNVIIDGLRFLRAIVETAFVFLPARFFYFVGFTFCILALILAIPVISYYFTNLRIEEGQFYRITTVVTLLPIGISCIMFGFLAGNTVTLIKRQDCVEAISVRLLTNRVILSILPAIGIVSTIVGLYLVMPGIKSYIIYGEVYLHWIFIVTALFCFWIGSNAVFFFFFHLFQRLLRRKMCIKMENIKIDD
ncbi:MAG TPA: glycosyltransferase family 2 protein [Nitrospirae bacterium]|nr:glycosyltransferase family 2 protein [Nitrospirota bacterium]